MTPLNKDRLIYTGADVYFRGVVSLLTVVGIIYTLRLLPAYDPAILRQPVWVTTIQYGGLAIGGLVALLSYPVFHRDRVKLLWGQTVGLCLQSIAAFSLIATTIYYGRLSGLFIQVFSLIILIMHCTRLVILSRELSNAPIKREIAVRFIPPPIDTSGDLVLQTMLFLVRRNEALQAQRDEMLPHTAQKGRRT